jgi:hypothetical protein
MFCTSHGCRGVHLKKAISPFALLTTGVVEYWSVGKMGLIRVACYELKEKKTLTRHEVHVLAHGRALTA